MKIAAIDAATEACSVAVMSGDDIYSEFEVCPQQHSQKLLPMLQQVLERADMSLSELDALAFGRGPGSFTGVRIATGMIQGLAFGTELPVIAVSTMAAMAQQAYAQQGPEQIAVAIDARMQEVYFAQYRIDGGLACLLGEEAVLAPELAKEKLSDGIQLGVGTGWSAYAEQFSAVNFDVSQKVLYPDAEFILPLAARDFSAGKLLSVEQIEPIYLRDKVTWKKLPGRE